ncbi:Histidine protein kinase DivJ [compost metagenome]
MTQTWVEVTAMIALITFYVKKNYNQEKDLAQSRLIALEEINSTKNKLFSIIAHDLRAPLASIENYLSLLNKSDLKSEEKESIEQQLLTSTRQTSEMLQNILYWSKDQMQGINAQLKPISIYETLAQTISLQQILAKEKNIQLSSNIDENLKVIADADMLQLICRNLLNNAIKFSSAGGTIKLSCEQNDGKCILSISDNGIGIKNENVQSIFSLKSQGSYGTQQEKGVGLGLVLVKTYVELQQGKIWFEENVGGGTIFYVSLTLAP